MLSELRHTHLVALIGYCNGDKEMLLVYEYMANGTVADHLYKTSQKESGKSFISHLMWEQRLNICIGAARGLDYLHTGTDKRFIHRDVKTPNILLDENWVAKIADFGLSKAITRLTTTHVTTKVKGTFGYYDLDYVFTGRITRKADVYAFGVVLLEVMCGRPALDARLDEEPEETISLTIWVLECIKNGKLDQVIDPSLRGQIKPQSLEYFVQLAKKCLQRDPKDRPTMVEVVESLKVALASQESSTVPFQAGSQKKIVMDLPKFVVLKSNYNNRYMRYINEEGEVHGFLQFTGDKLVSPYVMFKVETAESGDGRLVHIRCCYNNKYLARWSPDHYWIVAEADEPQEDQSKWSCTLFEPLFVGDDAKTVRLRHVQLNHYACLWRAAPPHNSCLFAGYEETDRDGCEVYTIIDLESVIGRGGDVIQPEGSCRCFSLPELFIATNCFDDALVLGTGGFGKVYKGFIDNGATAVAIKRLNVESSQGDKEFWTEINMLSELRHTHLVALIGYCNGYQEMLLVYEYMANGTLADHLYETGKKGSGKSISHLTWERRLNICIGAARGLNYLHIGTDQSFVHRSVKTANVLLDEKWIAKISDFGLSKPITTTHVSTNVKGTFGNLDPYYLIATFGYLDPDYFMSHRLTQKSDVYAFGVVLLEVLCGRPSVDARLKEEQISLKSWALQYIKKGKLDRVIDPSLSGQITPHSRKYFAKLVDKCLRSRPKERPTMAEVVASLEVAFAAQERKGRKQGMITKVFQGIALMLKGTP